MDPALQPKSIKPISVWIRVLALLISAPAALLLLWRDIHETSYAGVLMTIFAVAASVCVALPLGYLFLPSQRGPWATHLLGAAIGGLTAISLAMPVFAPLIRIQAQLMKRSVNALNLGFLREWIAITSPYGQCIEIVLIGMAAGWLLAAIISRLHAKRSQMDS